jgi:hypothetical protein
MKEKPMGVRTTLIATPPTASHQMQAMAKGVNASGLLRALSEQISEVVYLLGEIIKGTPNGALTAAGLISTSSASITMAAPLPSWVAAGQTVFDNTNSKSIGTVLSATGTTLTLTANAANAGQGSSDLLQIQDPNLSVFQTLLANLS